MLLAMCWLSTSIADAQQDRPNILIICIDDMNDRCGFLGDHPDAKTPHMNRLAAKGITFTNAHCTAPGCFPCRNALLWGVAKRSKGAA
ncbi:sulfatase-like hydrolase/transferase [Neorhodopirellula lusitana]|uniref:sulfatase-like hydrolase/transferase n=1 Tax=Neorhodopirellula lusitana TaxID=445327 RepID=UPI00384C3725